MNHLSRDWVLCGVIAFLVVASAMGCVHAKHLARMDFTHLQKLNAERDRLEVAWGQMQIEQSAWSAHARVEQMARGQMQLRTPAADDIRLVRP